MAKNTLYFLVVDAVAAETMWHHLVEVHLGAAALKELVFNIGEEVTHIAKNGVANDGNADDDFNSDKNVQGNEGIPHGLKMRQGLGCSSWANDKWEGKPCIAWIERQAHEVMNRLIEHNGINHGGNNEQCHYKTGGDVFDRLEIAG